jgi:AcrR family transcriptional regulator
VPRSSKPALSPRKAPLQARSSATVQVILQAAARVLSKESLAGFNTNRVAEVAGVSVGSLYQYFPNKDALVTALIENTQAALALQVQAMVRSSEGLSLDEKLRAMADLAVSQQFANPLLSAALDHEEKRLPLQKRLKQAEVALVEAVLAILRPCLPSITVEEVRDMFVITKALVESEADGRAPPADLQQRLIRAARGYLLGAHAIE